MMVPNWWNQQYWIWSVVVPNWVSCGSWMSQYRTGHLQYRVGLGTKLGSTQWLPDFAKLLSRTTIKSYHTGADFHGNQTNINIDSLPYCSTTPQLFFLPSPSNLLSTLSPPLLSFPSPLCALPLTSSFLHLSTSITPAQHQLETSSAYYRAYNIYMHCCLPYSKLGPAYQLPRRKTVACSPVIDTSCETYRLQVPSDNWWYLS